MLKKKFSQIFIKIAELKVENSESDAMSILQESRKGAK